MMNIYEYALRLVALAVPHMEILFILNVHVEGYIQSYCVHYSLTHEHKGTQWGGGGSYMEDHHHEVHHSYREKFKEIVQQPSITVSQALTAFQSV